MKKVILFFALIIGTIWNLNALEVKVGNQNIVSNNSLAIAKGFLKEEFDKIGVTFKVLNFDSGKDMNAAFASKSIDFGFLGTTPFVIGAVNGLNTGIVYLDFIAQETEGLVGRKGKFKNIAEIKGKKIAVPFGTSAHYALLQTLKINNISPKEVSIIDIPAGNILAAWDRGDVDLAFIWELTLSSLKNKEFLFSDKDLADKGVILADVLAVRKEFAGANSKVIEAYKRALDRAYEFRLSDPKGAAESISKFFSIPLSDASLQLSERIAKPLSVKDNAESRLLGTKDKKGEFYKNLYSVAEFLKEQKLLRKLPPVDSFKDFIIY
ncbi:hypothetical protein DCO58_04975 [Helicobacter saguini]|uniref:Solute-binding protein family 3/N-terminal domain-containing protein n=1 Tax=Helicobacter saguini TaxID=1548018 RepID=A0A347VSZ7_9HELI|nr:ABC transporter substrate-binding protein [Helicobacter saguini]MWV62298.1 hypothetical protein [Helicobacter saguini]MWV67029.1 hypothetical protein [Helicobacter saguini]MWV69378.1 hypothetical protein [Helicobacter saguini]MWV71067.1 hypothetical protein [Helicobacter saguini]TLD95031.1 hypothetical protein LS64_003735 [Helicobacter saguini]